jgi:hypothetical protein
MIETRICQVCKTEQWLPNFEDSKEVCKYCKLGEDDDSTNHKQELLD